MARFKAVVPVSDENTNALPVKNLDSAIAFYESVFGFSVARRDALSAVLTRDDVRIGLLRRDDYEPGMAGSLAFEVDDLQEMHQEFQMRGGNPGVFGIDEWHGK